MMKKKKIQSIKKKKKRSKEMKNYMQIKLSKLHDWRMFLTAGQLVNVNVRLLWMGYPSAAYE